MSRVLYAAGLGYVAVCSFVLVSRRPGVPVGPARGGEPVTPAIPYMGPAGQWFGETKPFCNAVEVEVRQQQVPPPPGMEGAGYSAACYALAGKIDRAREVLERLSGDARSAAAGIVFAVGHPVADAGDDQSAGPIMRLVVEYQPDNYMALYHAGLSEYMLGEYDYARTHLGKFLELYQQNDGWRGNAQAVLARIQ